MRRSSADFDGREIKTAGDSMLIVFAAPSDAVKFALHVQRAMRGEQSAQPRLPAVRAGVHQGQVVLEKGGGSDERRRYLRPPGLHGGADHGPGSRRPDSLESCGL